MKARPNSKIPALTGLRGVAAWWVALYHFREYLPLGRSEFLNDLVASGYLAVDLFFVLSGFVIYLNYGEAFRHDISQNALLKFLRARIARIYPLHFVMLLCFLLNLIAIAFFSHQHDVGARYNLNNFVANLFLVQNWGIGNELSWNIPAWSISTEWFAYLSFPIIAFLSLRYFTGVRRSLVLVLIALLTVGVVFAVFAQGEIGDDIPHLGLLRCVLEFAAGVGICSLYQSLEAVPRFTGEGLLGVALALSVVSHVFGVPTCASAPLICCVVVLGCALSGRWTERLLGTGPLFFLGEVSYSTYMIHYFIREWIKFALVGTVQQSLAISALYVALTMLGSVVLYRTVEVPGRRLARFGLRERAQVP